MAFRRKRKGRVPGRTGRRRALDYLVSLVIMMAVAFAAAFAARYAEEEIAGQARIVDGDTLSLEGGRVRLKGIDAPEFLQTCRDGQRRIACGRRSRDHLASLIGGGQVNCEGWEVDRYGRLLGRCRARGIDLNAAMVRDGWAVDNGGYASEEAAARAAARGIWAFKFDAPREWRRTHEAVGNGAPDDLGRLMRRALTVSANWLKSLLNRALHQEGT